MNNKELISRAKTGEVIGDGRSQIAALLEELDKRPTGFGFSETFHDDVFGSKDSGFRIEPGMGYKIEVRNGDRVWTFVSTTCVVTPNAKADCTIEPFPFDNPQVVIHSLGQKHSTERIALKKIQEAHFVYDSLAQWMQQWASWGMEPNRCSRPSESQPENRLY